MTATEYEEIVDLQPVVIPDLGGTGHAAETEARAARRGRREQIRRLLQESRRLADEKTRQIKEEMERAYIRRSGSTT